MALINFSGIASGIDTESLIKATSDATRKERVEPSQKKVTQLTDTDDALTEIKKRLSDLQVLLRDFASTAGGPLVKTAESSDETTVTATATSSASNGSFTIASVDQLATNATSTLSKKTGDWTATSAIYSTADTEIEFTVGSGSTMVTVTVPITPNVTTISDVVSSINSQTTRATASLVKIGTDYRIIINSNQTGTTDGIITWVDPTGAGTATVDLVETQAQDAEFTISGILEPGTTNPVTFTRSTNSVSDVIPGVTFKLLKTNTTTSTTITVSDDVTATSGKVQDFVDSYNKLVGYIQENDQISREEDGKEVKINFGTLSQTRVDNNALASVRSAFSSSAYSSGTYVRMMADLGITTDSGAYDATNNTGGGTLKFDSEAFSEAMAKEAGSVNEILKRFADTVALTGGTIDQFTRFNGMIDMTVNANKQLITDLNKRIAEAEANILKSEESMRARFARLESTIGKMQSQQSQLTSALAGLSR